MGTQDKNLSHKLRGKLIPADRRGKLTAAERQAFAVLLVGTGWRIRSIALELGVSIDVARRDIEAAGERVTAGYWKQRRGGDPGALPLADEANELDQRLRAEFERVPDDPDATDFSSLADLVDASLRAEHAQHLLELERAEAELAAKLDDDFPSET